MIRFQIRRLDTDRFREIVGAAGLILGAAGAIRLMWPESHRIGDGFVSCGSVISRQSSPSSDTICSHMVGTAALIGGLLVAFGALMFIWACVTSLRSTRARPTA
jgi:hypothetical protein